LRGTEKTFILPYLEAAQDSGGLARGFIDEERRSPASPRRWPMWVPHVWMCSWPTLRAEVDSIFDPAKYDVILTGTSVVFLEGSKYMVKNLLISLVMAVVLIAGLMALLLQFGADGDRLVGAQPGAADHHGGPHGLSRISPSSPARCWCSVSHSVSPWMTPSTTCRSTAMN
jgi:hypothetical protein